MDMVRLKYKFLNSIDIGAFGSKEDYLWVGQVVHWSLLEATPSSMWMLTSMITKMAKLGDSQVFIGILMSGIGGGLGSFFVNWIMIRIHLGFYNGTTVPVLESLKDLRTKRHRVALEKRLFNLYDQVLTDAILTEIMEVQLGLNLEADKKEVFWEQHAQVNWLQNDDRNTSFFHKVATSRYNRNRIMGLEDENGRWVSQIAEML
ncbi:hypothetical protein CXB51_036078 [Gossypium anomalum]|uniref:Uncharacterized protein n=1 Tax=Gossypium anomalum TaxID=47600 RepID=A0A8J6CIZ7_9ROSI|nr:hypothetical protein CXB51_036078 [Gossypium anomalum]